MLDKPAMAPLQSRSDGSLMPPRLEPANCGIKHRARSFEYRSDFVAINPETFERLSHGSDVTVGIPGQILAFAHEEIEGYRQPDHGHYEAVAAQRALIAELNRTRPPNGAAGKARRRSRLM
ncbi:hypothetical protein ASF00_05945 [Sphingomonas sp. Leaf34]|uniref:hypothetical protein n=1 Tax=Sphingomonas sp. Leaf34 TaxID=1736216 RepID=UPI0006FF4D8E|nr:hypothetical protein [Sphingomonas sp. Leaf34]KQN30312.1 hypothetical protein ASF00_05945 [Sphingomonas sp. Leaf34]